MTKKRWAYVLVAILICLTLYAGKNACDHSIRRIGVASQLRIKGALPKKGSLEFKPLLSPEGKRIGWVVTWIDDPGTGKIQSGRAETDNDYALTRDPVYTRHAER